MLQKIKQSKGKENKVGARLDRMVMRGLSEKVKSEHRLACSVEAGA